MSGKAPSITRNAFSRDYESRGFKGKLSSIEINSTSIHRPFAPSKREIRVLQLLAHRFSFLSLVLADVQMMECERSHHFLEDSPENLHSALTHLVPRLGSRCLWVDADEREYEGTYLPYLISCTCQEKGPIRGCVSWHSWRLVST